LLRSLGKNVEFEKSNILSNVHVKLNSSVTLRRHEGGAEVFDWSFGDKYSARVNTECTRHTVDVTAVFDDQISYFVVG
jgi:hypothetical protein